MQIEVLSLHVPGSLCAVGHQCDHMCNLYVTALALIMKS